MKTIKYVLAIAISAISYFSVSAQQLSVGSRGGVTLGAITRPEFIQGFTENARPIVSGNGGVFLEIAFGEHFALRPELAFVQKGVGAKVSTSVGVAGVDLPIGASTNLRVTNIQMPILAQYTFGQGAIKGHLIAGPAMAMATGAKLVTRPELLVTFRPIRTNINLDLLQYNKFEVSGMAGAGFSVELGGGAKLLFEGRYEHGFTRVIDVPVVRVNTFNQNVSFLAGFSIPIGQR